MSTPPNKPKTRPGLFAQIRAWIREFISTTVILAGVFGAIVTFSNGVGNAVVAVAKQWHDVKQSAEVGEMAADIAAALRSLRAFFVAREWTFAVVAGVIAVVAIARHFLVTRPRERTRLEYESERKNKIGNSG